MAIRAVCILRVLIMLRTCWLFRADAMRHDSMNTESMGRDAMQGEAMGKDAMNGNSMGADAMHKDAMAADPTENQPILRRSVRDAGMDKE